KVVAASVTAAAAGGAALLLFLTVHQRFTESGLQPQITPLTTLPGDETQPAFSPDGKNVLYVWNGENGDNSDIYMQSVETGKARRFTTDVADDLSPVWSPNGDRVAWLRTGEKETAVFVAPS